MLSWFGAHPVSGSVLVGHGSYGTYDVQQLAYDIFDFPAPPGQVLLWRELMIGVARDPAGSVVVRADAQIVWEPTRPLQSFVPGTAVRVVVTDTPPMSPSGTIGSLVQTKLVRFVRRASLSGRRERNVGRADVVVELSGVER